MGHRREFRTPISEKAIGQRLRTLRDRKGLSQVELAEKLGLNQPLVSQYERGEVRIHGALVAAFAKALGVSSDEILGLEKVEAKGNGLLKDRRFLRRLQKIEKLSKRQRQALLMTIDHFLKGAGQE